MAEGEGCVIVETAVDRILTAIGEGYELISGTPPRSRERTAREALRSRGSIIADERVVYAVEAVAVGGLGCSTQIPSRRASVVVIHCRVGPVYVQHRHIIEIDGIVDVAVDSVSGVDKHIYRRANGRAQSYT